MASSNPRPTVYLVVAGMTLAATLGLRGAFVDWTFLVPAGLGVAVAVTVALIADRLRVDAGESMALSLLGFAIMGAVAVSRAPSPGAFATFARGVIGGWADFLTTAAPVDVIGGVRAVPYAVGWFGTLIGVEIVRATRRPALPAVGPLLAAVLTVLITLEDRTVAVVEGALIVVGAIGLGLIQQRLNRNVEELSAEATADAPHRTRQGIAVSAALLAVIAIGATFVGPRLPLADANDRFDLRDVLRPPWSPLEVPSPLVELKASLKDAREEEVVFEVTGPIEVQRWRVAALSNYDGVIWAVADGVVGDAEFVPVGSQFPLADGRPADEADTVVHEVTIRSLGSHWFPAAGRPFSIVSDDDLDLRFNVETGTVGTPAALADGLTYRIESIPERLPPRAELLGATMTPIDRIDQLPTVPPQVRNLAADLTEGLPFGWAQVEAISDAFLAGGFYADGPEIPPGHSFARMATFLEDPERWIGYAEQYAAAAAVLTRIAEVPSRIVVGYEIPPERYIDGRAQVFAGDISAWLEVRTDEYGWVAVRVTPNEAREPSDEELGITTREVASPSPPPPPPPLPEQQITQQEVEDLDDLEVPERDEDENLAAGGLPLPAVIALAVAVPLVAIVLVAALVILLKVARGNRRRTRGTAAHQVVGAWNELLDRYREAGIRRPPQTTPNEAVQWILSEDDSGGAVSDALVGVAAGVDRAAYHRDEPTNEDAEAVWRQYEAVVSNLYQSRSPRRRWAMKADPRTLFGDSDAR